MEVQNRISIVAFIQHSHIVLFIPAHSWWYHTLHWSQVIDGPNFTAPAHLPLGYFMFVGPGLSYTFLLINRRVSINFALFLLLGYSFWRRYWATENLTTSVLVVKFDAKSSVGSSCCNSAFTNYCRKYKPIHPHVLNNKLLDIMPKVFGWVGVAVVMIKYIYDYLLDFFQRHQRCSSVMQNHYPLCT